LDDFVPGKMKDPEISLAVGSASYVRRELGALRGLCKAWGGVGLRTSWEPLSFQTDKSCMLRAT